MVLPMADAVDWLKQGAGELIRQAGTRVDRLGTYKSRSSGPSNAANVYGGCSRAAQATNEVYLEELVDA